jgi:hypothetical protein
MSEAEARQRITAQNAQADKLSKATVVIKNDGNIEETWKQVQAAFNNIQKKLNASAPAAAAPPAPPAPPAQPPASTDQLIFTFHVDPTEIGEYLMRLRIDGVDSVPLDPASEVPKFADDQKLEVT